MVLPTLNTYSHKNLALDCFSQLLPQDEKIADCAVTLTVVLEREDVVNIAGLC